MALESYTCLFLCCVLSFELNKILIKSVFRTFPWSGHETQYIRTVYIHLRGNQYWCIWHSRNAKALHPIHKIGQDCFLPSFNLFLEFNSPEFKPDFQGPLFKKLFLVGSVVELYKQRIPRGQTGTRLHKLHPTLVFLQLGQVINKLLPETCPNFLSRMCDPKTYMKAENEVSRGVSICILDS